MKEQQLVMLFSLCLLPIIAAASTEMTKAEKDCKCDEWMRSTKQSTLSSMQSTMPTQLTTNTATTMTKTATTSNTVAASTSNTVAATTSNTVAATTSNTATTTTSNTGAASTSNTGAPSTSNTGAATTSNTGAASTSNTGAPSTSITGAPSTSNTGAPSTSNTGAPSTSNTGAPSTSNTGAPSTSNTGAPSTSNTGAPSTSNTGAPTASNTGAPSTSNTGAPSTSNTRVNTIHTGDDIQNIFPSCSNVCQGYLDRKEQKYQEPKPKWSFSNLSVPLSIVMEGNFTDCFKNNESRIYKSFVAAFEINLTAKYNGSPGFIFLNVTRLRPGSIICDYTVKMDPNTSVSERYRSLVEVNLKNFSVTVESRTLDIQFNRTNMAMQQDIRAFFLEACTCSKYTACREEKNMKFTCSHKCKISTYNKCSKNGDCSVNERGETECRCHEDSYYVYKGDTCQEKVLVFFSGRNTAIIGSCAGVLIAVILLLTIYLVARWRNKRIKKGSDENQLDPKELQRDNSRIENVPMGGVGRANPAYQSENSDHSKHYEPYPGDRSNHYERYPGDRPIPENVYEEELAYNEGRYYRVFNDPESGTKAYVYQPSNISMPDKRTSTASKFDDLESKPPSYYLRPEKEQRPFHGMADRDQRPFHDMADRDHRFFQNKADRQQHPYKDMADRDQRPFHGMADRDQRPIQNNVDRQQRPFQDMADRDHQPFHDMTDRENPYAIKRPQIMRSMVTSDEYR